MARHLQTDSSCTRLPVSTFFRQPRVFRQSLNPRHARSSCTLTLRVLRLIARAEWIGAARADTETDAESEPCSSMSTRDAPAHARRIKISNRTGDRATGGSAFLKERPHATIIIRTSRYRHRSRPQCPTRHLLERAVWRIYQRVHMDRERTCNRRQIACAVATRTERIFIAT